MINSQQYYQEMPGVFSEKLSSQGSCFIFDRRYCILQKAHDFVRFVTISGKTLEYPKYSIDKMSNTANKK